MWNVLREFRSIWYGVLLRESLGLFGVECCWESSGLFGVECCWESLGLFGVECC